MKQNRFRRILLLCIFLGIWQHTAYAQTVQVKDFKSQRPIENVAIYNPEHLKTALSNIYGIADISSFADTDTLIFQHAAYQTISYSFREISNAGFSVFMEKKSVALDEIIISATRFEQESDEIPNKVISIPAERVQLENPQTTADMLGSSGEVFIQKSQLGGGSPMIRGFSANKLLIVVDGVRMNNAIFRSGNLQNVIAIDPFSLERTEVILGPGTVIYGSDALGGVMNFMTLDPALSPDRKFMTSVNIVGRYSSANNERTGHIDLTLSGRKFASVTSFSNSWFDDLVMGANGPDEYLRRQYVKTEGGTDIMVNNTDPKKQYYSGYSQLNLMQKFRYRPLEWLDLKYGFYYSETSDVPRYDRLLQYSNNDTLKYASWYYGPQVWMMNMLAAEMQLNNMLITQMKVGLAWQHFEESRHSRKFADNWFKVQNEELDMYTLNIDVEKRLDAKNRFFYGIEGIYNNVVSTAFLRDYISSEEAKTGTRYPDGDNDYYTLAAYLNYEHRFKENLSFFAGLRYNYVSLYSTFADTSLNSFPFDEIRINTGALNGSAGLSWEPAASWLIKLNLASGFRAPNLDDVGKVFDSAPGNVVVPNPDLKPEYAYSLDASLQKGFGDLLVLEVAGFYTYLIDAMVRRNYTFNGQDSIWYDGEYSQVEAIVNAGSASVYGISAMGVMKLGTYFKLKSGINWVRGEDDEGYALRHVSPLFGNTSLMFENNSFMAELYANYNGAIPYERLAPSERDKAYLYATDADGNPYSPSWWTLNFKASYRVIDELTIDIGIENILNERYRPYSSGIVSPGRNFILAIRARL
ncbi:MAG: TonB-dependent receptor [Bacteroidales bacterium]|jgi:hemoglobin/transferrin/lactoferrin receptor protein|nr:TonB-dependent receptor [Bacteroidales bacterium]